ncbi:hypothetical protein FB45DRAFT_748202 [Roridomyces roridus]|uniref:Uncharacterized protein n=1 Tax=Roridomyces roridus TaxID=1738132 RepID=A0AAD7FJN7_9AGAR|nr:hypothetical protein FB45DRAFT_748202 [Roridomyces roridus]
MNIFQGYFICFGTVRHAGSISWRLPLGLQAVVAIVLAIGTPFFEHSPHWLLSVGRSRDAKAAALRLGLQLAEVRKLRARSSPSARGHQLPASHNASPGYTPPLDHCSIANLPQAVNWVIAFSTPLFLKRSSSGPYFMFGTCTLLTVLICLVFQPETKGLSLETLDQGFEDTKLQKAVKRYLGRGGGGSQSGQSTSVELVSRPTNP